VADGKDPPRDAADDPDARRPFLLRLPAGLLADLRRWADEDLRSLNGHLEFLLRQALERRRHGEGASPAGGAGAPALPAAPAGGPPADAGERPGGDGEALE
jgi:hypothetical protein